jgi:hypothetical protein
LYPATLPKMLIRPKWFLENSLGSFSYKIISSNNDNLTSSFPIFIPFISFSRLISLAKNMAPEEKCF